MIDDEDNWENDPYDYYIDDVLLQHNGHDHGDSIFDNVTNTTYNKLKDDFMIDNGMKEVCDLIYIGGKRIS